MAIKSLNDAVEKLEEYLKLEKSFGLDELECDPSIFKNFHDEENDNIPLLIQGKKNKPDIQFIGIKSNKQQKNIFENDKGELLGKIINAMKYTINNVSVVMVSLEHPRIRKVLSDEIVQTNAKYIVALGDKISDFIGKEIKHTDKLTENKYLVHKIPMMKIYDLDYMVNHPESKKESWKILQIILKDLENK
ncbi:MAG: hypothetical protein ACJ0BW_02355 [Pontiellaceae bacterium]